MNTPNLESRTTTLSRMGIRVGMLGALLSATMTYVGCAHNPCKPDAPYYVRQEYDAYAPNGELEQRFQYRCQKEAPYVAKPESTRSLCDGWCEDYNCKPVDVDVPDKDDDRTKGKVVRKFECEKPKESNYHGKWQ